MAEKFEKILKVSMNDVRPRMKNRLSILSRIGRFFEKWLCCGKKPNIAKNDFVNVNEFSSNYPSDMDNFESFNHYNVCYIENDRNELINYGNGHYFTNNPSKFYLRDFFEIELTVLKPNKDNFDDEQFCKFLVNDLIDKTLNKKIKKSVSFLEDF